jgi:hypothetical protein
MEINNLFNLISSIKFKYLVHIVDKLSKLENSFIELSKEREYKLVFMLDEDIYSSYTSAIKNIEDIKNTINNLDSDNLDTKELERIAENIDILDKYLYYFKEKMLEL